MGGEQRQHHVGELINVTECFSLSCYSYMRDNFQLEIFIEHHQHRGCCPFFFVRQTTSHRGWLLLKSLFVYLSIITCELLIQTASNQYERGQIQWQHFTGYLLHAHLYRNSQFNQLFKRLAHVTIVYKHIFSPFLR